MDADVFADPIRFLTECHGRIRERLAILRRTAVALRGEGADRAALESALRFFVTSGTGHTVDEESSLFPRLAARLRERGHPGLDQVASLEGEHRDHDRLRERLEGALAALDPTLGTGSGLPDPDAAPIAGGTEPARAVAQALENLVTAYEGHFPLEEESLFPLAREVLTADDLAAIAGEMRSRRAILPRKPS